MVSQVACEKRITQKIMRDWSTTDLSNSAMKILICFQKSHDSTFPARPFKQCECNESNDTMQSGYLRCKIYTLAIPLYLSALQFHTFHKDVRIPRG